MAESSVKLLSGHHMPLVGLGTFLCPKEETKTAVLTALKTGYRHIDAAYVYLNEEHIGEALKTAFENKIVTREEIFITSKLPLNGRAKDRVQYFLKQSLSRLQLDYLDLYLVHYPQGFKYVTDDLDIMATNEYDHETTQMDTWRAMEECVDAGLTKSIGLSNYNSKQIKSIFDQARIKPSNLQVECHVYMQQEKLFNFCKDLGIAFTAYASFGNPEIAENRYKGEPKPNVLQDPVLTKLAAKYNKSTAQVILRWLYQRGIIAIPKSKTPSRIEQNFKAYDFQLTDSDMEEIKGLNKNQRIFNFNFPNLRKLPDFPFHEEF